MAAIKTYAFLDLETTGLPKLQNNQTQITELSLQCVTREELLGSARVCNKLTLCFEPTVPVSDQASVLTQLNAENLRGQPRFDGRAAALIESFLALLSPPVCLVAYNGFAFDFPILHKHLKDNGFAGAVQCADAYHGLFAILDGSGPPTMKRSKSGTVTVKLCPWQRGARPKQSYKLVDLYKKHVGGSVEGHRAENDCAMMMRLAQKYADEFVEWVDGNNCELSSVTPMGK
ncbi:v-trex [Antheraea pernyi nucleopolyhedrovirus]|uniref:3' repair exonuclease n=2 Tax=Antheraea pernyi nuclear polyhedrosis virus TaxID=161494 RepID=Q1HH62_NPVAP|nr:v-trex [Antheraea pernyi nucleopolyhedrovirus]AWD33553.1 EXO III v-trex [Antheraea proylei nucleopolyhedrovirus]BBD50488.1 three prime repair exonuclease [Antheraea yamamai nucleopolyhedrovirus]BBD50640.1 three prime repair exonuclease [Samia cynthia nucleopolyhedrovirus]ABF50274.1 v-trex [Antheraea pernyi nucleopolyhedrovirus]ABQ12262.1 EXO III v-trex [Antheraea pernyi nucleopolyhedrovirus]